MGTIFYQEAPPSSEIKDISQLQIYKMFKTPDEFVKDPGFAAAPSWLIQKVTMCKLTTISMHEYVYLRLRRRVGEAVSPDAESYILTERTPPCGMSGVSASSSVYNEPRRAMSAPMRLWGRTALEASDHIIIASTYEQLEIHQTPTELCTLSYSHLQGPPYASREFSPLLPSAADLGLLLKIVHQCQPQYKLLSTQCYWYAHTVYEALRQLFPNAQQTGGPSHPHGLRRGTFHGMEVPMTPSVDYVVSEFQKHRSELRDNLQRYNS